MRFSLVIFVVAAIAPTTTHTSLTEALSVNSTPRNNHRSVSSSSCRRNVLASGISFLIVGATATVAAPLPAQAAPTDCMSDCFKNCKLIAPKDPGYCLENCKSYCAQPDRKDGLSGSISSANGETGILGTNTVVKGDDRPPQVTLPGLDFTKGAGKKLIGY